MNQISANDLILIDDLCNWKITKVEFEKQTSFRANYDQLNFLLDRTEVNCTNDNINKYFDTIFWSLPVSLSEKEEINIYKKYLLRNWHHEHEEIVGMFQIAFNQDVDNINVLEKDINNLPRYLQVQDLRYSYIRKIIYAIGAQPDPYNIEALGKLAKETDDEQIKNLALHQIEKRKRLGRWEINDI